VTPTDRMVIRNAARAWRKEMDARVWSAHAANPDAVAFLAAGGEPAEPEYPSPMVLAARAADCTTRDA
jgi:hypothetical protein